MKSAPEPLHLRETFPSMQEVILTKGGIPDLLAALTQLGAHESTCIQAERSFLIDIPAGLRVKKSLEGGYIIGESFLPESAEYTYIIEKTREQLGQIADVITHTSETPSLRGASKKTPIPLTRAPLGNLLAKAA